jgi:hypothetical protein
MSKMNSAKLFSGLLRIGCGLLTSVLLGCAETQKSDPEISQIVAKVHSLNASSSSSVQPGTICVLGDPILPTVNLLSNHPLNETSGWFFKKKLPGGSEGLLGILTATHQTWLGKRPILIRVTLIPNEIQESEIKDPFACLEIVNRPVTGLSYNRDADLRISQWRESIAELFGPGTERSTHHGDVFLCVAKDEIMSGSLIIEGPIDQSAAVEIVSDLARQVHITPEMNKATGRVTGETIRFEVPIRGRLVIGVQLRKLELLDASPIPRIDFALGSPYNKSVFIPEDFDRGSVAERSTNQQ